MILSLTTIRFGARIFPALGQAAQNVHFLCGRDTYPSARVALAMLAWFQVACPACTAALQARLPAGTRSVQCGLPDCKHIFPVATRRRVDVEGSQTKQNSGAK
jgi:hypothetical protein